VIANYKIIFNLGILLCVKGCGVKQGSAFNLRRETKE